MVSVNSPLFNGNEKKYLNECIDTGWISSEGPFIKRFEDDMSSYVGRKYATACSSGSAAIDIAVKTLGLEKYDEVIMPTFTIISCIMQIVRSGAIPVLVDMDPITWNMDVKQIEAKITSKLKVIIPVSVFGQISEMFKTNDLVQHYN